MNLHEYQAKSILRDFGVRVQRGKTADTPHEAVKVAKELNEETGTNWWVIKAQIHAGGRGKGGGVKLAKSIEEVEKIAGKILGMRLVTPQTSKEGKLVSRILVSEDVYYPGESKTKEYYISILMNRSTSRNMIMYSPEGGISIEVVAEQTPDRIFYEEIDPAFGFLPFQARKIAFNLGFKGLAFKEMIKFITNMYKAYEQSDSSLLEINPMFKTSDNKIIAVDSKLVLDDNSLFRHKDYAEMRDKKEEYPAEVEAGEAGLSFVKLDGNVGCMVNGAGLAMATMDIIKLSGGNPANFLDVGGTADAERVEKAFDIILRDKNVKAILVNIFGGIVRCDRVAQGVLDAYKSMGDKITVPIVVRLQGTNSKKAKQMIDKSSLEVHSAITLEDAANTVRRVLSLP